MGRQRFRFLAMLLAFRFSKCVSSELLLLVEEWWVACNIHNITS